MDGNSDLSENLYLRKAIRYDDRQKMLKYLRNNVGVTSHGFIPVGLPLFLRKTLILL